MTDPKPNGNTGQNSNITRQASSEISSTETQTPLPVPNDVTISLDQSNEPKRNVTPLGLDLFDSGSHCSSNNSTWTNGEQAAAFIRARHGAGTKKTISIVREPLNLENFEQKHNPNSEPHHAPRKIFQRLLPKEVSVRSVITSLFPIVGWIPKYPYRQDLVPDILAGITILALHIPQGLAYSKLAMVPPMYGLYTSFFPAIIYALMGTSKQASMGTYAITSFMCRGVVVGYLNNYGNEDGKLANIDILITLSLVTGIIQGLIGFLRVGVLSMILSDNFLSAFNAGCAVLIVNSQVPPSLGIFFDANENDNLGIPSETINSWISIIRHLPESNTATLILSACVIVSLLICKFILDPYLFGPVFRMNFPMPIDLILIVVTTIVSSMMNLNETYKVDIVGSVESGFIAPALPRMDIASRLLVDSFVMSIISAVCTLSLARVCAKKYVYPISLNQEFISYGVGNTVSSFFHCFPCCASLARTNVNEKAGARSQIGSLVSCALLVVFLYFCASYLAPLPKATLSCIILVALIPSFQLFSDLILVWHMSRFDAFHWLVTFFTISFLGVNIGIVCGVVTSVVIILIRAAIPSSTVKYPVPNSELYLPTHRYKGLAQNELERYKLVVFAFQGPLTFLSVATFRTDIWHKILDNVPYCSVKNDQAKTNTVQNNDKVWQLDKGLNDETDSPKNFTLILDLSQTIHIDISGVEMLEELLSELGHLNIDLLLACCPMSVLSTLERSKFFEKKIPKSKCFLSVHDAVVSVQARQH